jgi:hypothetical protein
VSTLKPTLVFGVVAMATAMAGPTPGVSAQAAQETAVEVFTAFAVNTNSRPTGPNRPTTASLTISIERWSTDAEREKLEAIVKEQTDVRRMNAALLTALQALPRVGRIRESNTVGWDLRYARQANLDEGGRQILIATDRPIPFWEAREQPRSFDYRFTVLDMRLDKEHRGEGKMLTDTRLIIDRRTSNLVLEHYDTQPVRLNQIRRRS